MAPTFFSRCLRRDNMITILVSQGEKLRINFSIYVEPHVRYIFNVHALNLSINFHSSTSTANVPLSFQICRPLPSTNTTAIGNAYATSNKNEVVATGLALQENWLPLSNLDPTINISLFFCYNPNQTRKTSTSLPWLGFSSRRSPKQSISVQLDHDSNKIDGRKGRTYISLSLEREGS